MAKGSSFEREICTQLSLWWTKGERDDVFWRHDSGSRAKGRSRKGKTTFGAYGDIKASDPIGLPLTDSVTLELKRGYRQWSFLDCLDHPEKKWNQKERTKQPFEKFVEQVVEDAETANTFPVIIAKRDKRQKIIVLPEELFWLIEEDGVKYRGFTIKLSTNEYIHRNFIAISFERFLEWCSPDFFIERIKHYGIQAQKEERGNKKTEKKKKTTKRHRSRKSISRKNNP